MDTITLQPGNGFLNPRNSALWTTWPGHRETPASPVMTRVRGCFCFVVNHRGFEPLDTTSCFASRL